MIDILVTSERKGSNPGGKCTLQFREQTIDAYIKYCTNSHLQKNHPFKPHNQPVYEAITLTLAKYFGLEVPRYFLLLNQDHHSVSFRYSDHSIAKKPLDPSKNCYLLSEITKLPDCEDQEKLVAEMNAEKVYRDLLMIGDVSNKKQNYALLDPSNYQLTSAHGAPYIFYIDLGCSFVDAHEGNIDQRNSVSKLVNLDSDGIISSSRKHVARTTAYLERYGIWTTHKDATKRYVINLSQIPKLVYTMTLPTLSGERITANKLLSTSELELIELLFTVNIAEVAHDYLKNEKTNAIVHL